MSKLSKKELRTPDQVWQASAQTFSWLRSNWLLSSIVVVLAFILLVGALYIQQIKERTEAEAQAHYGELGSLFEQWGLADASQKEEIEIKMNEKLGILETQYPDSSANHLASLFRAKLKLSKGQAQESLQDLQDYISELPSSQRSMGLYARANVYEDLSQWQEALKDYESILKSSGDIQIKKWALLGKARTLTELNQVDEARATYDQFLQDFASSPEAGLARGLRARLDL